MSKLRTEWDNNKSLEFIQIRYTDVLGKFLARYLSTPSKILSKPSGTSLVVLRW
jgi:hypothetical protein